MNAARSSAVPFKSQGKDPYSAFRSYQLTFHSGSFQVRRHIHACRRKEFLTSLPRGMNAKYCCECFKGTFILGRGGCDPRVQPWQAKHKYQVAFHRFTIRHSCHISQPQCPKQSLVPTIFLNGVAFTSTSSVGSTLSLCLYTC
jgi:hypothetical protein